MTRDLTHVYESRSEAEAARRRLEAVGVPQQAISIQDQAQAAHAAPEEGEETASYTLPEEPERLSAFMLRARVSDEQAEAVSAILEGRPAMNEPSAAADAPPALNEQTFEFTETAEELVVEKELFIREEVVLTKRAENKVQQIDDSVRRREVEVERIAPQEAVQTDPARQTVPEPPSRAEVIPGPPSPAPAQAAVSPTPPQAPAPPEPAPLVFGDYGERPRPRPASAPAGDRKPAPLGAPAQSWLWWAVCALLVCFAVIVAYYVGRYLGSVGS